MAITVAGEATAAAEPNDVVPGYVDFKGRPSIRSKSGFWKSAFFNAGTSYTLIIFPLFLSLLFFNNCILYICVYIFVEI